MLNRACMRESQLLMQGDTAGICHVDTANHRVILLLGCGEDQLLHQGETDALAAVIWVDVN